MYFGGGAGGGAKKEQCNIIKMSRQIICTEEKNTNFIQQEANYEER